MADVEKRLEESGARKVFPRYCIVTEGTLAAFNRRSDDEIVEAQKQIDESMISALEGMVKAARAGRIEGKAALALEACAW